MNKTIYMDILEVTEGIICQQVNCRGVMGAGLAKQIAKKWPIVEKKYKECPPYLGTCQIVNVGTRLYVANLFGQVGTGNGLQTNYGALELALTELYRAHQKDFDDFLDIYIPFGMGCGLAGGDWNIVSYIIRNTIPFATICRRV